MSKPPDITEPIMAQLAREWQDIACVVVYYKGGPKSGSERKIYMAGSGVTYNPKNDPPTNTSSTTLVQADPPSDPDDPCIYYQGPQGWESICW